MEMWAYRRMMRMYGTEMVKCKEVLEKLGKREKV